MSTQPEHWLITGGSGMLAAEMRRAAQAAGHSVSAPDRSQLDIADPDAVHAALRSTDVVVNCAAYTDVDGAESDRDRAFAINADAAEVVARAAAEAGARMVHVSTDYVFAGDASEPYPAAAPLDPTGVYAESKAAGERAVRAAHPDALIVRTAWLYGAGGGCFPRTIAKAARERGHLRVVDDQRGQPTWAADVARVILDLVVAGAPGGAYHATSGGECSWFDFARAVVEADGSGAKVEPCGSDEFPRPAPRPAYSALAPDSVIAAGVAPIGGWRERWEAASAEVLASVD